MNRAESFFADAACSGAGDGVFFPDRYGKTATAEAVAICATCTVTDDCLTYALDHGIEHGVWGGVTPAARRLIAEHRPRPAFCPECFSAFEVAPKQPHRRYCTPACSTSANLRQKRGAEAKRHLHDTLPDPLEGSMQPEPKTVDHGAERVNVLVRCSCGLTAAGVIYEDGHTAHDLGPGHVAKCKGPRYAYVPKGAALRADQAAA